MKKMKIVIVGANHAGLATVRQLIQSRNEAFEITVIDKENRSEEHTSELQSR